MAEKNDYKKSGGDTMINDEESERRERNQEEAEKERANIIAQLPQPKILMPAIGLEFDLTDQNTRLLWKNPHIPFTVWRTAESYIKLTFSSFGEVIPIPDRIATDEAHITMEQRDSGTYTWYVTEAEANELIENDKRRT